jgi:hypothetical protein
MGPRRRPFFHQAHRVQEKKRFDNHNKDRSENEISLQAAREFQQQAPESARHQEQFNHDHSRNRPAESDPQPGKDGRNSTRYYDPTPHLSLICAE